MKIKQVGITLVEILLVLVIASLIIYLSIWQYLSYRYVANVAEVQSNVNNLFQAMGLYYRANCATGTLSPSYPQGLSSSFAIDIKKDLVDTGYFEKNLPLKNVIIDSSDGFLGYFAQFNLQLSDRTVCIQSTGPGNCSQTYTVGQIVTWKAQISVHLSNAQTATQYFKLLNADCLSSYDGKIITPCASNPSNIGDYAVWERLPSNANIKGLSDYWATMPVINQFKQMYSTNPITIGTTQYFVCGS